MSTMTIKGLGLSTFYKCTYNSCLQTKKYNIYNIVSSVRILTIFWENLNAVGVSVGLIN